MNLSVKKIIFCGAIALCILLFALFVTAGLSRLGENLGDTALTNAERALRRAAAACYAAEGVYPPTVDYLFEHYGVALDLERYAVFYEVFAENLMPEITVIER